MSWKNVIELKELENGDFEINFNNPDMGNIIIPAPLTSKFSCGALIAAGALCCTTGSMLYELDARKPGARYNLIKSSVTQNRKLDEKGRVVIDSIDVNIQVDVPEEHLDVFEEVIKEHEDNQCAMVRSLNRGIKAEITITKI